MSFCILIIQREINSDKQIIKRSSRTSKGAAAVFDITQKQIFSALEAKRDILRFDESHKLLLKRAGS